jgi:hypothetical protein
MVTVQNGVLWEVALYISFYNIIHVLVFAAQAAVLEFVKMFPSGCSFLPQLTYRGDWQKYAMPSLRTEAAYSCEMLYETTRHHFST